MMIEEGKPLMAKKEKPLLLEKEKPPRVLTAVKGADGLTRCPWPGVDPLYVAYHDEEWGVPEYDDRAMFEKLVLDGFQAGLSWITILRKRPAFRKAFDGFDPKTIVRWSDQKKDTLMQDAGIIRNRAKIEATVALARIVLDFSDKGGFARYLWDFVDGRPIDNARHSFKDVPAETDVSRAIAKDLRARGGNFVGPTIIYAFMQATGMVNDHLVDCCRHEACRALAHKLEP
jgi:DNA-3-methyladenine glycosylase I